MYLKLCTFYWYPDLDSVAFNVIFSIPHTNFTLFDKSSVVVVRAKYIARSSSCHFPIPLNFAEVCYIFSIVMTCESSIECLYCSTLDEKTFLSQGRHVYIVDAR